MKIWLIVYRVSCAALIVMGIVAAAGVFMPKLHENAAMRHKIAELEENKLEKEDMTQNLMNRRERFRTDPRYVEGVARERLGKVRPGEVIFRFSEPETNADSE